MEIITPRNSPDLSVMEIEMAHQIANDAHFGIKNRETYIKNNNINHKFALPDAN